MLPPQGEARCIGAGRWVLVCICWYALWAASRPACGQPSLTRAEERVPPKVWLEQYLGVEFPDSARHFVLYYRSAEEDVVLFFFDVAPSDLPQLMDGRSIFPNYGALVRGGANLPEQVTRDSGSQSFGQKVAVQQNALSAARRRTRPAEPLDVRLWTNAAPARTWEVYVSVIADKRPDKPRVPGAPEIPVAPVETRSCILIDSRSGQRYDTSIWQHWSLHEAGYREFIETMKTRRDVEHFVGTGAERLADRLETQGRVAEVPEWKPSELKHSLTRGSEPVEGLLFKGSENMSGALVAGRVDGLFRCYAHTQRNVLVPDPRDAIPRFLGLPLPASVREAHYESASPMGGIVFWIRFDLPRRHWETCLARTVTLPGHAEFTVDAALKEYLETGYHTGAPPWWHPEELQEGLYAQRKTNTKDLSDVSVGFGRLPAESVRVYIGAFSPW